MAQTYFASIQPGLEDTLLQEIRRLGGKRPKKVYGGVEFDAARKTLYGAHLQLRTPTRIWMRIDEFRARDAPELYRKTRRYSWERLIGGDHKLIVRAHSSRSSLYHTDKIKEAVMGALNDRFSKDLTGETSPEFVDTPAEDTQLIMARIEEDRCELSLDASGELLYRRGWRTEVGRAPLRETLAATLLELAAWNKDESLLDPFCGSGTIPIEAACLAAGRPPGLDRDFAFQSWRNYQPERFEEIRQAFLDDAHKELPAPIYGRDRNPKVIEAANRNATRARVADLIKFEAVDLEESEIPDTVDSIVTNPPYGNRLDKGSALDVLLARWKSRAERCHLSFLWPRDGRDVIQRRAPSLRIAASFENGGLPVDFWTSKE